MDMILHLMNMLKDTKNNGNLTETPNEAIENNSNLKLLNNNNCNENRMNQRENFYDINNLNSINSGINSNSNYNNLGSNCNSSNLSNDYLRILSQMLIQNQNQTKNFDNALINMLNSNNIYNPTMISNNGSNNQNMNNNNGFPEVYKTSTLISELINLEQQNKIQIELIQKILDTKQKNNSYFNNILIDLMNYKLNESKCGFEKLFEGTTKSTSRFSDITNKEIGFNNTILHKKDEMEKTDNNPGQVVNQFLSKKTLREPKLNDVCGHLDRKHYAKGMCNNCYHSNGRNKKAWKCSHVNKFHYALGVCQTCYQIKYTTKAKKANEENNTFSSNHSDAPNEEKNNVNENNVKLDTVPEKVVKISEIKEKLDTLPEKVVKISEIKEKLDTVTEKKVKISEIKEELNNISK